MEFSKLVTITLKLQIKVNTFTQHSSDHFMAITLLSVKILLKQGFIANMPLLTATSAFRLGRTLQSSNKWCYLHVPHTTELHYLDRHKIKYYRFCVK